MTAEWYYNGHWGQIGPLSLEQVKELVEAGVIGRDTVVWRAGMSNWVAASGVPELSSAFVASQPPPLPNQRPPLPSYSPPPPPSPSAPLISSQSAYPREFYPTLESDKSRIAGGIINLLLPGIGRIYLGYAAIGVLQLVLSLCGVGAVWAWIDGIIILLGGVKLDGYGRKLKD